MPLEDDAFLSKEPDGSFNEDYCKWCYADGAFTYASMDALIDYLTQQFSSEAWPPEQARAYYQSQLPRLRHWQPSKRTKSTSRSKMPIESRYIMASSKIL